MEDNQSTARAVDTSLELVNTVVAVVKEVGGILNNVPYVKALSGVILEIIKIRDVRRQHWLGMFIVCSNVWDLGNQIK